MLTGRKALDCAGEIGLPALEITERLDRMKTLVPGLYKLKAVDASQI